jgi:hypothetical protein
MVDTATPAELGEFGTRLAKRPVTFTANKDDPDILTMSVTEKDKDGNTVTTPVLKDVSRGEVKGYLGQYLQQDPDASHALVTSSRAERIAAMKARAEAAKDAAIAGHYIASTGQVEQVTAAAKTAETRKLADLSDEDFAKVPGSGLQDPVRMATLANDPRSNKTIKVPDPTTGLLVDKIVNPWKDKLQAEFAEYNSNPYVTNKLLKLVDEPGGGKKWGVMDPATGKLRKVFDNQGEAYGRLADWYPDPKAAGAQLAKTMAPKPAAAAATAAPPGGPAAAPPPRRRVKSTAAEIPKMDRNVASLVPGGAAVAALTNLGVGGANAVNRATVGASDSIENFVGAPGGDVQKQGVTKPGMVAMGARHYVTVHERKQPEYQAIVANPTKHSDREVRVAQREIERYNIARQAGWAPLPAPAAAPRVAAGAR